MFQYIYSSNRYTPIRRAGQQQHQSNSLSSSLSSSNNNQHQQHLDNHRNNSSQYSTTNHSAYSPQSSMSREPLTQHDELIRYIREAWTKVIFYKRSFFRDEWFRTYIQ